MYCSKCKITFDTKDSICPNCFSPLVGNLQKNKSAVQPDNSWVVIAGVNDEINKELAKGAIDAGNIPALFINIESKKDSELLATLIHDDNKYELEKNIIMVPKEYRLDALMLLKGLFGVEIDIEIKSNNR